MPYMPDIRSLSREEIAERLRELGFRTRLTRQSRGFDSFEGIARYVADRGVFRSFYAGELDDEELKERMAELRQLERDLLSGSCREELISLYRDLGGPPPAESVALLFVLKCDWRLVGTALRKRHKGFYEVVNPPGAVAAYVVDLSVKKAMGDEESAKHWLFQLLATLAGTKGESLGWLPTLIHADEEAMGLEAMALMRHYCHSLKGAERASPLAFMDREHHLDRRPVRQAPASASEPWVIRPRGEGAEVLPRWEQHDIQNHAKCEALTNEQVLDLMLMQGLSSTIQGGAARTELFLSPLDFVKDRAPVLRWHPGVCTEASLEQLCVEFSRQATPRPEQQLLLPLPLRVSLDVARREGAPPCPIVFTERLGNVLRQKLPALAPGVHVHEMADGTPLYLVLEHVVLSGVGQTLSSSDSWYNLFSYGLISKDAFQFCLFSREELSPQALELASYYMNRLHTRSPGRDVSTPRDSALIIM